MEFSSWFSQRIKMNAFNINIENDIKKFLILIVSLQFVFLILLLKSASIGVVFALLICGAFLLYLHPEFAFSLILTGYVLIYLFFDFMSIDIHFIAFLSYLVITFSGVFIYLLRREEQEIIILGKIFWISILIGLLMFIGLLFSTNRAYGLSKTGLYFLFNIVAFMVAALLAKDSKRIENLAFFTYLLGLVVAIICFDLASTRFYFKFVRFRLSESIDPIILSRSLGISVLSALYLIIKYKELLIRLFLIFSVIILVSPMIWTGSRAPILGLILTVLLFFILQPSQPIFRKVAIVLSGIGATIYYVSQSASQVTARMATPVAQEASAAFRILAWFQAIQDFGSSPITGIGTGSFFLNVPGIPLTYPHNLVLELACENGIIGFLLVCSFLFIVLKYGIVNIKYYNQHQLNTQLQLSILTFCLFFFSLWNSMFSGKISANAMVWFAAGLIWALYSAREYFKDLENVPQRKST